MRAHQPGKHGRRDRLDVELCRSTLNLDLDTLDAFGDQLAHQRTEPFRQLHIRAQAWRFLGAQRGHVERVGNAAGQQEVRHLLGDLDGDIDLGFVGRSAKVRRRDEIGGAEQRRCLGWFLDEHIERGAADMTCIKRCLQRHFVDQPAARAIDDAHALFRLGEVFRRQDVAGAVGQRRVQRDKIGLRQQFVECDLGDAHVFGAFGGEERVIGDDLHLEAQGAVGDDAADVAGTDEAERLGGQLDPHEAVLLPFAGLGGRICLGKLAGECEHQRNGMFGGGDRIAKRRVHHDNPGT